MARTSKNVVLIKAETPAESIKISAPNFKLAAINIKGTAPYVQHKFSEKARKKMEATQRAGTQARGKRVREPRDFEADVTAATHFDKTGRAGIPASAFRNAMIDACRLVGYKMTVAKLSVFIEADAYDADDGTPLVWISGKCRSHEGWGRNDNGSADLRWRPMWEEWSAVVRIRWDMDQFSPTDVLNLFARAGIQVGIGEGRPGSPNSNGLGWGTFEVTN